MSTTNRTGRSTRSARLALVGAALIGAASCGSATATGSTVTSVAAATTTTSAPAATTTAVAAVSTVVPTTTTAPRPTSAIDELVGAEGARIHVRCAGHGDTTVVLIAGFGSGSESWVKVEPDLAGRTRVCSYDRPGTGTSDPATATTTFTRETTQLHTLLATIGESGPYVLVGHSFGGAEAVTFASMFPAEVTGLVLVDASPATWPAALCAVADDGTDGATMLRSSCTGSFLPTGNSEHLDVAASFSELSGIASLGSLPMAVVTAVDRALPADLAATEVARLTEVWNQGQHDWMALSTAAHLVPVEHTGHHIEIEQPGVVIDEITRLLP